MSGAGQEVPDEFERFYHATTASREVLRTSLRKEREVFRKSMLSTEEMDVISGNRNFGGGFIKDAIGRLTGAELVAFRKKLADEEDRAKRIINVCVRAEEEITRELKKLAEPS